MNQILQPREQVAEFELSSRTTPSNKRITVEILEPSDLPLINNIQAEVVREVGESQFSPVPAEPILSRLIERSSFGAFSEGKLVAVLVDFLEEELISRYEEKTGLEIDQSEGYRQYFYIVDPEYRGFSITQRLFQIAMHHEKLRGTTHVIATVAPFNVPSLKVLLNGWMTIRYVGPVYGEKIRFITYSNLQKPVEKTTGEVKWQLATEIDKQQALIKDGHIGNQIDFDNGEILIGYQKLHF